MHAQLDQQVQATHGLVCHAPLLQTLMTGRYLPNLLVQCLCCSCSQAALEASQILALKRLALAQLLQRAHAPSSGPRAHVAAPRQPHMTNRGW
jgi:hypothetical protein